MDSYQIEWKRSAVKELKKLDKAVIPGIIQAVEDLSKDPRPAESKKIRGAQNTYRIRKGSYRIVYRIASACLIIEIVRIGHRKEVYEKRF